MRGYESHSKLKKLNVFDCGKREQKEQEGVRERSFNFDQFYARKQTSQAAIRSSLTFIHIGAHGGVNHLTH